MKDTSKIRDLTGQRFGRLIVIGLNETNTRKTYWICQCDCGNMKSVRTDNLIAGKIQSCGCLKAEQDKKNLINPNMIAAKQAGFIRRKSRLYNIWQKMKARCYNVHDLKYDRYGGRGISVCEEWNRDFIKFHDWSLANGYNDTLTIDRIDNDGNYSPDNCRWSDSKTQCRNRGTNINITIGNSTRTLTEWCEIFELDYKKVNAMYHADGFISVDDLFNG